MDASWLAVLLSAAVFLAIVLLAAVCLDCGNKGPMVSIRQASDDYTPSTDFRIIHPSHTYPALSIHSPSQHLSPHPNSVDTGIQRHRSFTPTETESNPSYENPGPESNDSDDGGSGYIIVLADDPNVKAVSRASTPSSDPGADYVNIEQTVNSCTTEDTDYQNVEPLHGNCYQNPGVEIQPSAVKCEISDQSDSNEEESSSDDDDDEGNYVNQPIIMDLHPAQCMMGRVNNL